MRKRYAAVVMMLIGFALGCESTKGPIKNASRPTRPDPLLTSEEKQSYIRDRLAIPMDDPSVKPNSYERYGPANR